MTAIIRQENTEDFPAVFEVNRLAFGQDSEARLVERLRESAAFVPELSLVAVREKRVIGHILFTRIQIGNGEETASLALAPMAVLPAFQKLGTGSLLIKHSLAKARELQYRSVVVLGHEHYYPKFGFEPAGKWGIRCPYNVPQEVFMAQELVPGGLAGVSGLVKYPEEFDAL